jgi:hypothetical protein
MHAREDVGDVVDGVDAVLLAAADESVEDREVMARVLVADKEEILSPERKSRFILPVSRSERGSTTRGIPRFGTTWTCCTKSRVEAKTSTSASGPTGRG